MERECEHQYPLHYFILNYFILFYFISVLSTCPSCHGHYAFAVTRQAARAQHRSELSRHDGAACKTVTLHHIDVQANSYYPSSLVGLRHHPLRTVSVKNILCYTDLQISCCLQITCKIFQLLINAGESCLRSQAVHSTDKHITCMVPQHL